MAFNVRFNFTDLKNGDTSRTWVNTGATVAAVLLDVTTLVALYAAIGLGGLDSVLISQRSTADAFAPETGANVDDNASVQVLGGDGYKYDFDLPMPEADIIQADRSVLTTDAAVIAFFAAFASGSTWRINLRNPTDVATVIGGTLDK